MRYLLTETNDRQTNALLETIAEFLWNNGSEIYLRKIDDSDYQNLAKNCDGIVLLTFRDDPEESLFTYDQQAFFKATGLMCDQKLILFFTMRGVYCNVLPPPYRLFLFEQLTRAELARFFRWCEKLGWFTNCLLAASAQTRSLQP